MDPKDELLLEIKQLIADSQKENVTEKALNAKVEAINKMIAEKLDNAGMAALNASVEKLLTATGENAAAIKAMNEKAKPAVQAGARKSLRQAVEDAIMEKAATVLVEKNDDNGKRLSMMDYFTEKGNKTSPVFTLKAVDMLESGIIAANVVNINLTENVGRVSIPLTIYPHVIDWMPSRGINKPYMSVLVVYSYSDGAGVKVEGQAPGKSSFLLKTVEFKAFTIATYATVSDETLDDLPELLDEISLVFPDKINDAIDSEILGIAGDDTTTLAGMGTANKHTDYSGAAFAQAIAGANMVDLIDLMAQEAKANKYRPDSVVMNPQELTILGQTKDLLNNSISDRRISFDSFGRPSYVCGLKIYETAGEGIDTMFVLDSKQTLIGNRKNMTMEIGYNGTDLTQGQKTIVFKIRIAFAVRDKAGVIYSDSVNADWNALIKV